MTPFFTPMQINRQTGFTLVEMAVVLVIVALLLGGLLPTIANQVEQQRTNETRKQLDEIQQALVGYAVINGRLPCPATVTPVNSNGAESFDTGNSGNAGNGKCADFYGGYVPAATLGLSGTDSSGFAIDPWGNRIRYAVTLWNYVFTSTNGMSTTGISNISPNWEAYLQVCSTASGISGTSCNGNALTSSPGIPVVIFSTGKNGAGSGTDELANSDGNKTFVSHTPTPRTVTNGEFDDIMIWLSPNVLINRMVTAGKLP